MRSSVAALIRESLLLISAALLSCALLPLSAAADEGEEDIAPLTSALVSTRTVALPATSLSEARAATITSGTVELAIAGDAGDQPIPTVRTTYVVRGCAYSFDQGAGAFALVNAANAELTEEGYLVVPASLMLDGTAYPVRSIEPYALSETRAPLVALSSEIERVSEDAAAGCGILQAVYVSPDNETYSSYDGCLYNEPRTSLLLIPEGKQGTVRIAPSAENVDPEEFSHCPSVDSISADADSAAFSSGNDCLYNADGTELLRVPAKAKSVTIARTCTSIGRSAFTGCTSLKTIMVEGSVEAIHPEAFNREAKAEGDCIGEGDDDPHDGHRNEVVRLIASDQVEEEASYEVDPSAITVIVADEADAALWEEHGFGNVLAASGLSDEEFAELLDPADEAAVSNSAAAGQPLYGESGEPIDYASVVIPEDAFAPIEIPVESTDASTELGSGDGDLSEEGDADSTASPSDPATSDALSMRIVDAAPRNDLTPYVIFFRANGGEEGSVPSTRYSNPDGSMPDISGSYGEAHKPRRSNYVFMGFYDGSDYTKATRYYNADFTQDDACKTEYDFGADGLILYAGWAPMIKVDVPAQVTILSGTEEWDGPQAAKDIPIYNYSPYEVVCSYLEWDDAKVDDSAHEVDHIYSTMTEKSDPALSPAPEVVDASSTHGLYGDDGVFSDGDKIALRISLSSDGSKTGAVKPGSSTALAQDIGHIKVSAAENAKTPSVERFDYTLDVEDGAKVQVGEAVSNTTLISRFEASSVGAPVAKAAVMFDQNGCDDPGYLIKSIEETYGTDASARASLKSGYGDAFTAPERYGYTFKGYYDDPVWNRVEDGEPVAHRYFDAQGHPVGTWDKTSATVLYAGWENKKCTIVFDANGGYFDSDPSETSKVYDNIDFGSTLADALGADGLPTAEYRIDASNRVLSRSWWTERSGGEDLSVLGLQNVAVDSLEPITFYAHWNDDATPLFVTLNANGGHFGDDLTATESTISTTIGGALGDAAANAPTNPGFTLLGWSLEPAGEVIEQTPPVVGTLTLYAQWQANDITVTWDKGTWGSDGPVLEPFAYTYAKETTLNDHVPADSRMDRGAGFTFKGFYLTDENGDKVEGSRATSTTPLPTANTTYTAFWDIDIAYDCNGGAIGSETTLTKTQASGGTKAIEFPDEPVREGYDFVGWFTSVADDATRIDASFKPVAPATYVAHWAGKRIELILNANGGAFANGDTTKTISGTAGSVVAWPDAPTREGYVFDGWCTDAACTNVAPSTMPTANATYYAKWKGATITIKWDSRDGSAVADTSAVYGPDAKVPLPAADPTRDGYDFIEWNTKPDGTGTKVDASTALPSAMTTYYAKWQGKSIVLTWNVSANSGSLGGSTNDSATTQTYGADGNKVKLPEGTPTRLGYAFTGWYTQSSGGERVLGTTDLPVSSTTYYAQFADHPSTVTFDLAGGSWNMPSDVSVVASIDQPMPAIGSGATVATAPTRLGYVFEGFYSGDVQYYASDLSSARDWDLGEDTRLVAKWTPYKYTIVFNTNTGTGDVPPGGQTIVWGEAGYTIPSSTAPTNEGGPWLGWALDDKAKKPDFDKHATITGQALYEANGNELHPNGSTITLYAVYRLVMNPKDELEAGEEGFYLHLGTTEISKAGLSSETEGYYYAEDIKAAADDIAEKRESSEYFKMFNRIMQNDVQFTTRWNYYTYDGSATPIQRTSTTGASPISYKVRIIGINHDDLTTVRTSESGASVTKAGLTFQFVDLLYNAYQMNEATGAKAWCTNPDRRRYPYNYVLYDTTTENNSNAGGWGKSELRANMNPNASGNINPKFDGTEQLALLANNHDTNAVWDLAPDKLKDSLSQVKKKYYAGTAAVQAGGTPSISNDWMFIPSYSEIIASGYYSGWGNLAGEGSPYWYYQSKGVKGDKYAVSTPGNPNGGSGSGATADFDTNKYLFKFHILDNGTIDKKILKSTYGNGNDYNGWTQGYQWDWWERSSSPTYATDFTLVNVNGLAYNGTYSSHFLGVAPCFSI